ncbi:hypothetical protein [Georgenia sp. SYP-B2076]|uniref:hypothetical protein n=1 Tax=Georgenia sp. SYP-B2076 TaxID=2495881 RepID=UPI0013E00278|nr:hypothetical protein [Georgenia sp. SYP-B2076]
MKSSLVMFAAQETEHAAGGLTINPYLLGGLTLCGFIFLLLVTYAFRNVGTRH